MFWAFAEAVREMEQRCICDDVDDCIGVVDECGICNGHPTQVVIDDIIITYDSVFLPLDEVWFVYAMMPTPSFPTNVSDM